MNEARRIDWDQNVPAVQWASRAMHKNLSADPILKVMGRVEAIGLGERNPHIIGTIRKGQDEGIMPPRGAKHMQIQEAIRKGHLKIRELEEDRVWLREKSRILDEEINKLETKITQAGHTKKLSPIEQKVGSHTTALEGFWVLLPWLWLHLTRQRNRGSAPCKEECEALIDVRVIVRYPRTRLEGARKPCAGGKTT